MSFKEINVNELDPGIVNPGLAHCRWILHQLSHRGSPIIQEWVA